MADVTVLLDHYERKQMVCSCHSYGLTFPPVDLWRKRRNQMGSMGLSVCIYTQIHRQSHRHMTASQTEFPHLRLLLNLANISCPSVDTLDSTLSQLATRLNTLSMDGSLTYQHIREAALEIPHYIPTHRYLPTAAQSVASIGDIGYMRGDTFVKLDSMASEFCEGFGCMPNHSVASATIASDILEDGSFR